MDEKRGYGQFCPVALAAEVVAERWTPLVIRELLSGSVRFNELQRGLPRMSSALLARRLRELEFAGIVERRARARGGSEYHLTPAGRELMPVVEGMGAWAQRWLRHKMVETDNLDPDLLMWDIRRRVAAQPRPREGRYVARFHLAGVPASRRRYWLVFEPAQIDICYKDPGFEVDLFVETSLRVLTEVWLGHLGLERALREETLRLDGAPRELAGFRSWFALGKLAPAAAATVADPRPGPRRRHS